jgi:hypothetical protein
LQVASFMCLVAAEVMGGEIGLRFRLLTSAAT